MANIHIKTEERRQQEAAVLRSYGVAGRGTPEQREAAAIIAARSREIMKGGNRNGN